MDQSDQNIFKSLSNYLQKAYKKEIQEELELEKRYNLNHTPEEISRRKEYQEKYKFYHLRQHRVHGGFVGLFKTYRWLRKHYFNFKSKDTIEEYEYYQYIKKTYTKIVLRSMFESLGYTFIFFLWVRLLKHKGRKDIPYLIAANAAVSLVMLNKSNLD